ncbi:hypothetical protein [Sphingomonas crusticola]|uniref:hypothetical protein n=1 Tax=Sphingomonas crusticola TaxID=1697973 RepID=UPI000E26D691|nr:hypothetical protein [Sphingomonas crusticola]
MSLEPCRMRGVALLTDEPDVDAIALRLLAEKAEERLERYDTATARRRQLARSLRAAGLAQVMPDQTA